MQATGTVYLKVDGKMLASKPGASIDIGGVTRKTVMTSAGPRFVEEIKQSITTCTIAHDAGTSLTQLGALKNATIEFATDTGKTFLVPGAWLTDTPKVTGGEGDVDLAFEGPPAKEL